MGKKGVCLAMRLTLHEEGTLFYRHFSRMLSLYEKVFVILKPGTGREALSFIKSHGDRAAAAFTSTWKRARREVLGMALAGGAQAIHHCDADPLLHWFVHYPDELKQAIEQIPSYDYLIMGRTRRAFQTYPSVIRETDILLNHVFALVYNQDVDIATGSRGMSAQAGRWVLERTQSETSPSMDSEWPLLVRQHPRFTTGYTQVEGLEWAAADQRYAQGADEQSVRAWREELEGAPEQWVSRLRMALSVCEAMLPFVR